MPPKKSDGTKAKSSSHASYQDMITDAIVSLKDRNGSSRQSLKKGSSGGTKLAKKAASKKDGGVKKAAPKKAAPKKATAAKPKAAAKPKKATATKKAATPKKAAAPRKSPSAALSKPKTGRVTKPAAKKTSAKKATPKKAAPKKAKA